MNLAHGDAAGRRSATLPYDSVAIMSTVKSETGLTIRPEALKTDAFRANGPGGQPVQKSATAVRITHRPTGIAVSCQPERSQYQNREYAMRILRARLLKRQDEQPAAEPARTCGERNNPEWSRHIRSYFLHLYKLVKDHCASLQSAEPESARRRHRHVHPRISDVEAGKATRSPALAVTILISRGDITILITRRR